MKKFCKRKVWPLINVVQHAIEGAAITPDHLLDQLRIREQSALEAFTSGQAGVADWKAIADLLNVAETLARGGIGPEVLEVCDRVQAGLDEARERHNKTRRMGLSGLAIQAIRDLIEYHQLQRTSISRGEYERYIRKTADRIRSKHPSLKVTVEAN